MDHDAPDGYDGDVDLTVDGDEPRTVHAALAARFDPLAGHVVWSGRLAVALPLRIPVVISTPHGSGVAETTERDPWGNTRVIGTDRPPFPVEVLESGPA